MAPRKLSDSDKSDIIELYRQLDQTTSTLAAQYGVSNSTISRILKTTLPPEDYAQLISQKRMAGSDKAETSSKKKQPRKQPAHRAATATEPVESEPEAQEADSGDAPRVGPPKLKTLAEKEIKKADSTRRRRSKDPLEDEQLPLLTEDTPAEESDAQDVQAEDTSSAPIPVEDDDDDLIGLDETLDDDFGDDDDDIDDDDDDIDDEATDFPRPKLQSAATMEIMPLGLAVLPKPCYLVVDMRSELITRPLSDFADLGQIPTSEEKAKTLPVFDNHRVARRFSRSKQRVIKVPDGNLITRTSPYLQAKGITRLLVDGQVFDLMSDE
ncbi:MAG: hypothetical protein WBB01_23120 [Phormidesmis sp.]